MSNRRGALSSTTWIANYDVLDLIEVHLIPTPVVMLHRARAGMVRPSRTTRLRLTSRPRLCSSRAMRREP